MSSIEMYRAYFDSLYAAAVPWATAVCGSKPARKKTWVIAHGGIKALCWSTERIPKAGLSLVIREQKQEVLYRIGLNIYARDHRVPDGSFAVLFSSQQDSGFIGGVIELFPATRMDEDLAVFKKRMQAVARQYGQDYELCRSGLDNSFRLQDSDVSLGAGAGFNFYRAGLEATHENLLFAGESFLSSLDEFKTMLHKADGVPAAEGQAIKEVVWRRHLKFMKEEDAGIQMSLEQGIPFDFFPFSAFPPVAEETGDGAGIC